MTRQPVAVATAAAPWRQRLDQIQSQLQHEFRVLVCGGPQVRGLVAEELTELDGPLRLVPGPGCPVSGLSPDVMALLCELAPRPDLLCCAPEWVVRNPAFAARQGAASVVPVGTPLEALTLVVRHPDRHVVLYAAGGEADARGLALVAYQAREVCVDRFSMLMDVRLAAAAAGLVLGAASPPFDAVLLPQIGSLLPDAEVSALSTAWGLPVAAADGSIGSMLDAVAGLAGLAPPPTGLRPGAARKGHPSRWLLERVFQVDRDAPGKGQPAGIALSLAPAFAFLDSRRVLGLPAAEQGTVTARNAPTQASQASARCRNQAACSGELCPVCLPTRMPLAAGRHR